MPMVNILEGGSITVEGPFFDAGASALAVTGGTRAYRGARGRMRLVPANETATEFDFIFRSSADPARHAGQAAGGSARLRT
jgi:hypothetical protein